MLILPITRFDLLTWLPKQAEVAEIGVALGNFSSAILVHGAPRRLHLVDAWAHFDDDAYRPDPNNVAHDEQEARYQGVLDRFKAQIRVDRIRVHRGLSADIARDFPDHGLDWVYIDANHTFEGVLEDLHAWGPKVRPDGFILGHDYYRGPFARQRNFEVVGAVDAYVRATGARLLAITLESFATFVLARDGDSAPARDLEGRLAAGIPHAFVLDDALAPTLSNQVFIFHDQKETRTFCYGHGAAPGAGDA